MIAPADGEGAVIVTHRLVRAFDPAEWTPKASSVYGGYKVTAAGRIATYGVHLLKLDRPRQLVPRDIT